MPKKPTITPEEQAYQERLEKLYRSAGGTIGGLERMAGIPGDDLSRLEFWRQFRHLSDAKEHLDAGVAELKRIIADKVKAGEIELPD